MKLQYTDKLLFFFLLIFVLFTSGVIIFERVNERHFKKELVEEKLLSYIELIDLNETSKDSISLNSLVSILPQELRLTIIDDEGKVFFDNDIDNLKRTENHLDRPEVVEAQNNGTGQDIRISSTFNLPFLYVAKKSEKGYIRVALPYNQQTKAFLRPDNTFVYFILVLFLASLVILIGVSRKFNESLRKLQNFVLGMGKNQQHDVEFPPDELGEISKKIKQNYLLLDRKKQEVDAEREKLLKHVKNSKEGMCFFTKNKEVAFYNDLFIRYINVMTREIGSSPKIIFEEDIFKPLHQFLSSGSQTRFTTKIKRQGKVFSLQAIVFEDKSFELIVNNISRQEKNKRLKREMTGNIAHELRTPVATIRGYLETIQTKNLTEEERSHFINQAFKQSILLSNLISDMRLISKIEEADHTFKIEEVDILEEIKRAQDDLQAELTQNKIAVHLNLPDDIKIKGSRNLIYSVFKNLIDNSIRYSGGNCQIVIRIFKTTSSRYYFSYFDTGNGVLEPKHLPRLFERFYRIHEGRTRDTGGTGLGLSIVKNAVAFHRGEISAKQRSSGGLEFLFALHK